MTAPYHPTHVVQRARLLATRKLSALDISKALQDEGFVVHPTTIYRWTTGQYRQADRVCPVKRRGRLKKLRAMAPPCVSDTLLAAREAERFTGNALIGHNRYNCKCEVTE